MKNRRKVMRALYLYELIIIKNTLLASNVNIQVFRVKK